MPRSSENAADPTAILEEHKVVFGKLDSVEEPSKMVKVNVTSEAATGIVKSYTPSKEISSLHLRERGKSLAPILENYVSQQKNSRTNG